MRRRIWIAAVAAVVLSGCGAAGVPMSAMTASGAMQAAAAKKTAPKNPFLGLTVTVEPLAVLCPCVSISATNDAKLKIAVSTEDDKLDTVKVNRSVLVNGGKLNLVKAEPSGLLLIDEEEDDAAMGAMSATDKSAKRRASFLSILDKLADGRQA
jgi:hypothetical protein